MNFREKIGKEGKIQENRNENNSKKKRESTWKTKHVINISRVGGRWSCELGRKKNRAFLI
jgi:hypothetical protein